MYVAHHGIWIIREDVGEEGPSDTSAPLEVISDNGGLTFAPSRPVRRFGGEP